MDAAAVKQLQKHYYRKAVGASALALVGYCLLSLYLQWLLPTAGRFLLDGGRSYCSGSLGQGTFWLEYRYGVAQLQRSELYFALSQIILIPVTMMAAGWKCRRDAGASSSLTHGKDRPAAAGTGLCCGTVFLQRLPAAELPLAGCCSAAWDCLPRLSPRYAGRWGTLG